MSSAPAMHTSQTAVRPSRLRSACLLAGPQLLFGFYLRACARENDGRIQPLRHTSRGVGPSTRCTPTSVIRREQVRAANPRRELAQRTSSATWRCLIVLRAAPVVAASTRGQPPRFRRVVSSRVDSCVRNRRQRRQRPPSARRQSLQHQAPFCPPQALSHQAGCSSWPSRMLAATEPLRCLQLAHCRSTGRGHRHRSRALSSQGRSTGQTPVLFCPRCVLPSQQPVVVSPRRPPMRLAARPQLRPRRCSTRQTTRQVAHHRHFLAFISRSLTLRSLCPTTLRPIGSSTTKEKRVSERSEE